MTMWTYTQFPAVFHTLISSLSLSSDAVLYHRCDALFSTILQICLIKVKMDNDLLWLVNFVLDTKQHSIRRKPSLGNYASRRWNVSLIPPNSLWGRNVYRGHRSQDPAKANKFSSIRVSTVISFVHTVTWGQQPTRTIPSLCVPARQWLTCPPHPPRRCKLNLLFTWKVQHELKWERDFGVIVFFFPSRAITLCSSVASVHCERWLIVWSRSLAVWQFNG